jgi:cation diffusion facilitator CzcD-associated flavoprotein CzcO
MREMDTDYLVVGAGAAGLPFVDTLVSLTDARVVIVDREPRPGGHWLHAYPFVRLHQPSANYGVASRPLGADRVDTEGPNAGFYERASAREIVDHLGAALDDLVASGRVTFLGSHDYRGEDADGHHVRSLETGEATTIRARTLVDATFMASDIPSRHTPSFAVDDDVRFVPPNALPDQVDAPAFTILGAGKTAMDSCVWLLEQGVDPGRIRWLKPREAWLFDRAFQQPLDQVAAYMQMQAHWVTEAARSTDGHDFTRRLADAGVLVRVDEGVEGGMFRGAIISRYELDRLRSVEDIVRGRRVRRIASGRLLLDDGDLPARPGEVHVDCTAHGVPYAEARPSFARGRITLGYVTLGIVPWSAATVAAVEASHESDEEKNRLTPAMSWTGRTSDVIAMLHAGMSGLNARAADPVVGAWNEACRLNPASGAIAKAGSDPAIGAALTTIITEIGPALENLQRYAGTPHRRG